MRKLYISLALGFAIILGIGFSVHRSNLSPLEVASRDKNASDGTFSINDVLYESPVAEDKYIIIYNNSFGNVCNVLLEAGRLGYEVVDFNGEMSCENSVIPVGMHYGWYRHEEGWVGSGVVYSDDVAKIIIDGEEANISNTRVFFKNIEDILLN
ncbi:hypothetical protein AN1V17_15810 [Vallitalea sediminicola]